MMGSHSSDCFPGRKISGNLVHVLEGAVLASAWGRTERHVLHVEETDRLECFRTRGVSRLLEVA